MHSLALHNVGWRALRFSLHYLYVLLFIALVFLAVLASAMPALIVLLFIACVLTAIIAILYGVGILASWVYLNIVGLVLSRGSSMVGLAFIQDHWDKLPKALDYWYTLLPPQEWHLLSLPTALWQWPFWATSLALGAAFIFGTFLFRLLEAGIQRLPDRELEYNLSGLLMIPAGFIGYVYLIGFQGLIGLTILAAETLTTAAHVGAVYHVAKGGKGSVSLDGDVVVSRDSKFTLGYNLFDDSFEVGGRVGFLWFRWF